MLVFIVEGLRLQAPRQTEQLSGFWGFYPSYMLRRAHARGAKVCLAKEVAKYYVRSIFKRVCGGLREAGGPRAASRLQISKIFLKSPNRQKGLELGAPRTTWGAGPSPHLPLSGTLLNQTTSLCVVRSPASFASAWRLAQPGPPSQGRTERSTGPPTPKHSKSFWVTRNKF